MSELCLVYISVMLKVLCVDAQAFRYMSHIREWTFIRICCWWLRKHLHTYRQTRWAQISRWILNAWRLTIHDDKDNKIKIEINVRHTHLFASMCVRVPGIRRNLDLNINHFMHIHSLRVFTYAHTSHIHANEIRIVQTTTCKLPIANCLVRNLESF